MVFMATKISSIFEFTNVKCTSLDPKFDKFEYCYLKSVNRSYKYVSIKVNLLKTPVTKVKVIGVLFKRFNGNRPFMYNMSIDACRFLRNPQAYPIAKFFFEFLKYHSNINHSCPFDHPLILDKLPASFVNNQFTKDLPFPGGDYLFESHWIAYDVDRAVVKFYGTLS
ncbi:uncharacterized protein [Drosophila kikkawai]|uniref:Uncharacterized protein n=1 Tax=Drosophila kikkawai TaxID=30033 RepID=A0A6P4JRQ2_DROKI|nr:uncharacterized protein LOC108085307 [Drosophila kikkawai]